MNSPDQTPLQPHPPPLGGLACADWSAPAPPWLCPLSEFRLIRVAGKDAFTFLNDQLSNDLRAVSEEASQLSGYCNPKGRLYAVFRVFMRGADYYLRAAADNATIDRLRMFVLRAQVTLSEDTALGGIGLIGADAARLLSAAALPAPAAASGAARHGEYSVIRAPGACARYEIHAPHAQLAALWETLAADAAPAGGVWRLYDVFSGIPNIHPQTRELFVPQMVNLDLVNALSFSKGCYPGQEVVARMHYRGKLKRRMYRFASKQSRARPAPGDAVFVPAYSAAQPSGEIVDACALPGGALAGLASLRIQGLEPGGEIRLGAPDGAVARIEPLPYDLNADTHANAGGTA